MEEGRRSSGRNNEICEDCGNDLELFRLGWLAGRLVFFQILFFSSFFLNLLLALIINTNIMLILLVIAFIYQSKNGGNLFI